MAKAKKIPAQIASDIKRPQNNVNPDSYMTKNPVWVFRRADQEQWKIHDDFIEVILPELISIERLTWHEIMSASKGGYHSKGSKSHHVDVESLTREAQERLQYLHIYEDQLFSLRISGTKRLWGIIDSGTFNILWYDPDHKLCPSSKD